ncbi:hypothetical protein SEA_SAKAI_84 [Arthrobacter phage Sakai]|nr:hypothetical protein SEA_GORPY_85 [Arthrobacter phage Gorpy]UVK62031.1 hypothetical protein SEA_SAKAI_84 [Arthrobacter phage Sakai]
MHDPMIVAFEIRRPWPQRSGFRPSGKRWKVGASPFWTLAGTEYYWPSFITVWHVDPSGHDAFHDCPRSSKWQWHVHHWRIQVSPLQQFRRWALTRCEWCNGRSRKGDLVNHSKQWHREKTPWWKGERGLFHSDCSTISNAHNQCVCHLHVGGPWESNLSGCPYGLCATCGKFRGWEKDKSPRDAANRLMQTLPVGGRDDEVMRAIKGMWKVHRSSKAEVVE